MNACLESLPRGTDPADPLAQLARLLMTAPTDDDLPPADWQGTLEQWRLAQELKRLYGLDLLGWLRLTPTAALQDERRRRRPQLVDLDQIAASVRRCKKTLQRRRKEMPPPAFPGAGSAPSLWHWHEIRPWLEVTFRCRLPERFPGKSV